MLGLKKVIKLYGFNNLTKALSFNIYDICYAKSEKDKSDYIKYIDEQYNSERLTNILCEVSNIIGASILNISKQDYEPQGASVAVLISEEKMCRNLIDPSCNRGELLHLKDCILAHLDKSHLTVHSYPESHPDNEISTFRVDIDVSTCGEISPLNALNFLIGSFDSDIITMDYRVRGFTRDINGQKYFIDHDINSIQDYINEETLKQYDALDVNIFNSNLFHTKMKIKELNLNDYLFNIDPKKLRQERIQSIKDKISKEMNEIYYGKQS